VSRARRHVRSSLAFALGVALLTAGCGGGGGNEPAGADAGGPSPAVAAAADRIEGRYAHYDVVAYEGSGMKTMIISYGFTDYDRTARGLRSQDTFCFSEARSDQPIEISFSDAATQAIKPEPVDVEVTTRAGRAHVSRPETPTGIGVRLDNPADDPLPSDPSDPRIVDDDDDGKPGVTATVVVGPGLEGEIYLARREIFAYEVDEQPDRSLTGVVQDRSEQLIVGASDPIFETPGQWTQHPDLTKSPIILIPVSGSWDCTRLRAERDALFPPTPSVDY
jgi:hypothetical protein